MADEQKKIIVDDDWKKEAQQEKERLSQQAAAGAEEALPEPSFVELVNLIAIQALVGLGLMGGPRGERIPPNPEAAKHFVDMLQVLEDKTKGNLTADERKVLDGVLYEIRMRYVEVVGGGTAGGPGVPGVPGV
jgi:hypothetical protein